MKRPIAEDNAYYREVMRVLRLSATLLPFFVVPVGLLVRIGWLDDSFYLGDGWYFALSIGFIVTAIAQYFMTRAKAAPEVYLFFSIVYHVLGIAFLLTVTGFVTPALVCWVALIVAVDAYFGTTAFLFSVLALNLTGLISLFLHADQTILGYVSTFLSCAAICLVGWMISRVRTITDRERLALIKTRHEENFQRERLLALINSMGDAVIATDEEGVVKLYNAATLSLLDTNASLTNKKIERILQLYSEEGKKVRLLKEAQEKHIVFSRSDVMHRFKDGEVMNLYINVSPIQLSYQSQGERGYIFIMRDITKEKSLEEERDEFISVVSHELRTPVAIVEGNLSNIKLLQDHGATKAMLAHALDDAYEQTMYLAKMVNDLGTLSRAERGLDSAVEPIDTAELLTELYKTYLPQAQKKNLRLDLDLQPRLPEVRTSRLYLEEVLQNLITNAIKYTKNGSVSLISLKTKNGVYVAVKDTGIGISKSDQRHIFEKFYRSEDYRTRESNGTGLGLYVTQKLATKMGIKVEFESRLNHGSTFSFVLPVASSDDG